MRQSTGARHREPGSSLHELRGTRPKINLCSYFVRNASVFGKQSTKALPEVRSPCRVRDDQCCRSQRSVPINHALDCFDRPRYECHTSMLLANQGKVASIDFELTGFAGRLPPWFLHFGVGFVKACLRNNPCSSHGSLCQCIRWRLTDTSILHMTSRPTADGFDNLSIPHGKNVRISYSRNVRYLAFLIGDS